MKKLLAVIALGLTMMTAAAQSHNVVLHYGEKTWTDGEQEVVDQQIRIWDLMTFRDVKTLNTLFAPNAIFLGAKGYSKADQVINTIESGAVRYKKVCVYDMEIRCVGKQVMVYSTITIASEENGKEVITPFYVTSLFAKGKNEWQIGSMIYTPRTVGPDGQRISITQN